MEGKDNHKSPIAALLWSFALPGFGQLYNGDYLLGIILMGWEILLNVQTNLNLGILYTFQGNFERAEEILNYEWGLFYPSIISFSLWQAYNRAKSINQQHDDNKAPKQVYLTGFLFGLVVGMNMGIDWHNGFLSRFSSVFNTPIYNGLAYGLIGGCIGYLIEALFKKCHHRYGK